MSILVEVILRTLALEKIDLPGEIYLSTPEVNLSRVTFSLDEKVTLKKLTTRYFLHANRKQHVRKSRRSKEMVLLF